MKKSGSYCWMCIYSFRENGFKLNSHILFALQQRNFSRDWYQLNSVSYVNHLVWYYIICAQAWQSSISGYFLSYRSNSKTKLSQSQKICCHFFWESGVNPTFNRWLLPVSGVTCSDCVKPDDFQTQYCIDSDTIWGCRCWKKNWSLILGCLTQQLRVLMKPWIPSLL